MPEIKNPPKKKTVPLPQGSSSAGNPTRGLWGQKTPNPLRKTKAQRRGGG